MDIVPIERVELLQELGALLRAYREKRNIKAKDIAGELGVASPRMTRIEQGLWMPDSQTLSAIATFLKLDPDSLEHLFDLSAAYLTQREAQVEKHQARLLGRESRAQKLQIVARTVVPPLVQTEKYAREVLRGRLGLVSPSLLEEAVATQKEKLSRLDSALNSVSIIIFEDALVPQFGSRELMDEQIEYLTGCPYDLSVVPKDAPRSTVECDYRVVDERAVLFDGPANKTLIAFCRQIVLQYAAFYDRLQGLAIRGASLDNLWRKYLHRQQGSLDSYSPHKVESSLDA